MSGYDIKIDIEDQKRSYFSSILWITLFLSFGLFGISLALKSSSIDPYWLILAGTFVVSGVLYNKKLTNLAIWSYLMGLLLVFASMILFYGPNANIYWIMLIPQGFAIMLLQKSGIIKLAVLTAVAMIIATLAQTITPVILLQVAGYVFFPIALCMFLTGALYLNLYNTSVMVYWATDIQQKDTHRAEMFYEQREQLGVALRQLTYTHSRLKTLNSDLEVAKLKTEQASQAKSIFLSNMSHELRTPLNVIIGYTSTMLDMPQMYQNILLPDLYRADIRLIKDNGYYLLGLINDILDLSKIEAGKLELSCAPVKLTDILRGTIATAIGLIKDKPVQIRPDYPEDLPYVFADTNRVRQIILNLMSNAIKFTHTGSVTLKACVEDEVVRISVIDTGIGIPEKALAHIFDRFEQAERDTDKHYGGTGLGLDISKQLAKMHGGALTVQSVVGQGSTFSFTLPISVEQHPVVEKPQESSAIKALSPTMDDNMLPKTILLVEDEASLREMIRRSLESAGNVVVDIQDGAQVLESAVGLLPDLIVLDICLPNLSGWEALEALKQNQETANIPVIVCTVSDDHHRAMKLGAALYVQKPFSSDELCACVEELLLKPVDTDQGV